MSDTKVIHYVSTIKTLEVIKQLTDIALKAHGLNPSPVDIKIELSKMDSEHLLAISSDINKIVKANNP